MTSGTMSTITMVHYVDVDGTRVIGTTEHEVNQRAHALAIAVIKAAIERAEAARADTEGSDTMEEEIAIIREMARGYMGPDSREVFDGMAYGEQFGLLIGMA
jgi:hypothetical protein